MSGVARVRPGHRRARWSVQVPGSKSLSNRALAIAGVAHGRSRLANVLAADDTRAMRLALEGLGVAIDEIEGDLLVGGLGGPPTRSASVHCGMGATVGRFLLPIVAAGSGRFVLDAHEQLARRPLVPLLDALGAQGVAIHGDAFPLELETTGLSGGEIHVDASLSSQFLSGLMLAAPLARARTLLRFDLAVSRPYVELTAAVMATFGVPVELGERAVSIDPAPYLASDYVVEPDASTASYFLAAAALGASTVTLPGLSRAGTGQGDIVLADHLVAMGASLADTPAGLELSGPESGLAGVHVEMSQASDVFMTLACVAPFARTPTTIEGLANVRVKESDRLAATAENLARIGVEVDQGPDFLSIQPVDPAGLRGDVRLPTYADHRIAMAFSLIGTRVPVELEEPRVVDKTCPGFWDLWPSVGASVELIDGRDPPGLGDGRDPAGLGDGRDPAGLGDGRDPARLG